MIWKLRKDHHFFSPRYLVLSGRSEPASNIVFRLISMSSNEDKRVYFGETHNHEDQSKISLFYLVFQLLNKVAHVSCGKDEVIRY